MVTNVFETNYCRQRCRHKCCVFFMIFNVKCACLMIRSAVSFGARKVDEKMVTCFEFRRSNTVIADTNFMKQLSSACQ
jgi:hypothetical protein